MDPLATGRLAAYALDMTCCLGIAAATVPLGLALRRGRPEWISEPTVQALSAVPVVAATAWAAWAESGPRQGTPGKRAMGLRTEAVEGGRLPLPRAAVRATATVAIPWQLGHTATIHGMWGGFEKPDALLIGSYAATYAAMIAGIVPVVRRGGRTIPDLLAGSRVVRQD